jgi:hypothetical protein
VLRLGSLLGLALLPAFGVFYRVAEPEAFDPILVRALMAGCCLAMFVWSRSRWVEERVGTLLLSCVAGVLAWSVWIAWANDYSANYSLGLFAVFVTGAMLLSMGYAGTMPLIVYLCAGMIGSVAMLLADQTPAIDAAIFTSCLLVVAVMHYVVVSSRSHLQEALEEREAQLAEAQQTAGLGSWTWIPDTGRVTWSAEMYRLPRPIPTSPRRPWRRLRVARTRTTGQASCATGRIYSPAAIRRTRSCA